MSTLSKVYRNVERGLAFVGLMTTAAAGIACYGIYTYRKEIEKFYKGEMSSYGHPSLSKLPSAFILHLDLDQTSIVDSQNVSQFDSLFHQGTNTMTLRSVVKSIESAKDDHRVKGFVTTGCDGVHGLASIQELRSAVIKFNEVERGRKSIFYADSFGEAEDKTLVYYLASAYHMIYMQPTGRMTTVGFSLHTPFFKDFLSKWNVDFRVWAKEEYKNAFNMLTHNSFTQPHEDQMRWVLDGMFDQVTAGIAEGRDMRKEEVEEIISSAPLTAEAARAARFVDRLMYRDDIWQTVDSDNRQLPRISIRDYYRMIEHDRKKRERKDKRKAQVAVLTASGNIVSGWGQFTSQRQCILAGRLNQQLADLEKNQEIKAVVLRVDSSGGSSVASDAIRKQLSRVKESGKYVVVSMGNIAASGGYYIALGANSIVANPGTMTGSIGVIVSSPFLKDALSKQGINVELLKTGQNSALLSPFAEVTQEQEDLIDRMLNSAYDDFLNVVHEQRELPMDAVRSSAKGRVWLGQHAHERQLVDELGGLSEAIALAKGGARLPADARVIEYPTRQRFFEILETVFRQFNPELPGLSQLRSSVEMYSFEADVIFGSIS